MISDIGKWVNFLNKKMEGVGCTVDKETMCKDLKLTSISVLGDYIKDLKGRMLTKRLLDIKYSFEIIQYAIKNNVEEDTEKLPFLAITYSLLQLVKDLEKQALQEGKSFDSSKYLKKFEKKLKKARTP